MQGALFLIIGIYCVLMLRFWWAWKQLPTVVVPVDYIPQTAISVIIAVRNEAHTIETLLQQLVNQQYPAGLMEIILIDDHSEDNTAAITSAFSRQQATRIRLINLQEEKTGFGKKAALLAGITKASGELLVFTDGDCEVQPRWLAYLEWVYKTKEAQFISGPVSFHQTRTVFEKMQLVEFAALIGVGGSSIFLGSPNMCNGANIGYSKQLFKEVNGFSGNEHIASGDDEFLLHKAHQIYPEAVYFIKAKEAIVTTSPKANITDFFAQRVRWAGKWPAYTEVSVKGLAFLVFGVNALLAVACLMVATGYFSGLVFTLALVLKFAADLFFLFPVLQFFQKTRYVVYTLPLMILNIPYVVVTALFGLRGQFSWKGRTIITKPKTNSV